MSRLLGSADLGARVVVAVLLDRLADSVRQGQLGCNVPGQVFRRLAAACRDGHPVVRGFAVRAASRLARNRVPAALMAGLEPLLTDPCPAVRIEAIQATARLQRVSRVVVEGLAARFADGEAVVRAAAAGAVADLGPRMARPAILSGLAGLLADESEAVVCQAARTARVLARRMTRGILNALLNLLAAPSSFGRVEAVRALGAAGQRISRPRVVKAVRACLEDEDSDVCRESILAWEQVRRAEDPAPTEALARLLVDRDSGVRLVAVELVGRLGRQVLCSSIINGLAALLGHDLLPNQRQTHLATLVAVAGLGPSAAISVVIDRVIACLFAGNRELAAQACRTIERLGPAACDRLVETLTAMLCTADRKERFRCLQSLIQVGAQVCCPALLEQLLRLLNEPEAAIRAAAASALGWLGPQAGTPAILARLDELQADPDGDVRYHAGNTLHALQSVRT
jgi:HEAT repeat protein